MGGKNDKAKLPNNIKLKALNLFNKIDIDGSNTIDRNETLNFWSKNFPKINSNEFFDQVDKNKDGTIQLEEWLEFWAVVFSSGYTEEEISSELDNMMSGGSWVKFDTKKSLGGLAANNMKIKKKGKC